MVGWDELFNQAGLPDKDKPVKFHDVPFEFQIGVLARFDVECHYGLINNRGKAACIEMAANEPARITKLFEDLQQQIKKQQK